MRVVSLLLGGALLAMHSPSLAAQGPLPLAEVQPGARVRVEAPGIVAGKYVGTVLSRRGDTLTLGNPSGTPVVLPFGSIGSLEISRGKSRTAGAIRGMLWGAPIGAALGIFGVATAEDCTACYETAGNAEVFAAFTAAGVLWGAGIGAIVGRERWERFDLPRRTALLIGPRSAAFAVVLSR
jgi:hypothetical protein